LGSSECFYEVLATICYSTPAFCLFIFICSNGSTLNDPGCQLLQTATSINAITFKLSKTKSGEYEGVCLNPKDIPPDDLDDVILGRMIKEAGMFYKMELERRG
jgi:hypothetical protein